MKALPIKRLYFLVVLLVVFFFTSLVASHYCESLLMTTSSYQMLYHVVSIAGDLISNKKSTGKDKSRNTYGWTRIKLLSLLISTLLLGSFCFSIFVEALQSIFNVDLHHTQSTDSQLIIMAIGGVGIFVHFLALLMIGGFSNYQQSFFEIENDLIVVKTKVLKDDNIDGDGSNQSCLKEEISDQINNNKVHDYVPSYRNNMSIGNLASFFKDSFGFVLLISCGLTKYYLSHNIIMYIDQVLSFVYIIILIASSYSSMKKAGFILMQSIPPHIDVESLTEDILKKFSSIASIHDMHIWQLSHSHIEATFHAKFYSMDNYEKTFIQLKKYLNENGIPKVTIQPEVMETEDQTKTANNNCLLLCEECCKEKTCCGLQYDYQENETRLRKRNVDKNEQNSIQTSNSKMMNDNENQELVCSVKLLDDHERIGEEDESWRRINDKLQNSCSFEIDSTTHV